MPDSTGAQNRSLGQRMKRGVQTKILIPAAASIVSVAVSYLIKKLPTILEEKVLPKLQDAGSTESKTEATKQFAHARAEDAAAVADIDDDSDEGDTDGETSEEQPEPASADLSAEDREEERSRREQRRQERKRSTQKAA